MEYLESHAQRIYSAHSGSLDHAVRVLAAKIQSKELPDPFTLRDVYRPGWSRLDTLSKAKVAADELLELGWLRSATETGPVGGRPKTSYFFNPKVARP